MNNPCHKHCPDRAVGCHSFCERYKAYRKYLNEKNEAIRQEDIICGYKGRKGRIRDAADFKNPKRYGGGNSDPDR